MTPARVSPIARLRPRPLPTPTPVTMAMRLLGSLGPLSNLPRGFFIEIIREYPADVIGFENSGFIELSPLAAHVGPCLRNSVCKPPSRRLLEKPVVLQILDVRILDSGCHIDPALAQFLESAKQGSDRIVQRTGLQIFLEPAIVTGS